MGQRQPHRGARSGRPAATIPPAAELLINATYLPAEADASGFGAKVRSALTAGVTAACAGDGWLAQHPPSWTWPLDYPPLEIPIGAPILASVLTAASAASGEARRVGSTAATTAPH